MRPTMMILALRMLRMVDDVRAKVSERRSRAASTGVLALFLREQRASDG
jgi:hypothetical protein